MNSGSLYCRWPGLEHWKPIYHFFHHVAAAKPMPSVIYILYYIVIIAHIFCVMSLFKFFSFIEGTGPLAESLITFIENLIYLQAIPSNYLAPILFIFSLFSIGFVIYVYLRPHHLAKNFVTKLIRFYFQVFSTYLLLVSSSLLQKSITEIVGGKKLDYFFVFSAIDFLICFFNAFESMFFFSYPMSCRTLIFTAWDLKNFYLYIFFTCFIQQLWSLVYKYKFVGGLIVFGFNFIFSVFMLIRSFSLVFFISFLNMAFIFMYTYFALMSIIFTFVWCFPNPKIIPPIVIFALLLFIFGTAIYSQWIYNLLSEVILSQINRTSKSENESFEDLSENSEIDIELPHLPPKVLICLLRYLGSHDFPDVNELAIRVAEIQENSNVVLECFRILHLNCCVPTAVYSKILDISNKDVGFFERPLLCNLQYEAIKYQSNDSVIDMMIEHLDKAKSEIHKSLQKLAYGIQIQSLDIVSEAHFEYNDKCAKYEEMTSLLIENIPNSITIATHYHDYLLNLRGNYIADQYWCRKVEFIKTHQPNDVNTSFPFNHENNFNNNLNNSLNHHNLNTDSLLHHFSGFMRNPQLSMSSISSYISSNTQEIITQEASYRIKLRSLQLSPAFLGILFISMIMCLCVRPLPTNAIHQEMIKATVNVFNQSNFVYAQMALFTYPFPRFVDYSKIIIQNMELNHNISCDSFKEFVRITDDLRKSIENKALSFVSSVVSESMAFGEVSKPLQQAWFRTNISDKFPYSLHLGSSILSEYISQASERFTPNDSTVLELLNLSNDIGALVKQFVNALLLFLEGIHDNILNKEICWILLSGVFELIMLIALYLSIFILPGNDFKKFYKVLFLIDTESITDFSSSFGRDDFIANGREPLDLEVYAADANSLTLDEIELSDDNPLALQISLPNNISVSGLNSPFGNVNPKISTKSNEIVGGISKNFNNLNNFLMINEGLEEETEKKKVHYSKILFRIAIFFGFFFIVLLAIDGMAIVLIHSYGMKKTSGFSSATSFLPQSMDVMISAYLYISGLKKEKPQFSCKNYENVFQYQEFMNQMCELYTGLYDEWNGEINDQFVAIVKSLYGHIGAITTNLESYIRYSFIPYEQYKLIADHSFSLIGFTCILISISLFIFTYLYMNKLFRSILCILRIIPSRYFSPISAVLGEFENGDSLNFKKKDFSTDSLNSVIMHSPDPIIVLERDLDSTKVIAAGQSAMSLLNYKTSEIINNDVQFIIPGFEDKYPILSSSNTTTKIDLVNKNGTIFNMKCTSINIDDNIIALIMKNTEELSLLTKQIKEAQSKLEQFLVRIMPIKYVNMYLEGKSSLLVKVKDASVAYISLYDNEDPSITKCNPDILLDYIDFLNGTVDRILTKYPCISKLGFDDGIMSFIAGATESAKTTEELTSNLINFLFILINKINAQQKFLELKATDLKAVIHTSGPVNAGIISKECPVFKEWSNSFDDLLIKLIKNCPTNSIRITKKTKRKMGKLNNKAIKITKEGKNSLTNMKTYLLSLE
ncbi:hypothetical protein TRFO_26481 [Tritrichomonas foetus]|uniref:Uncharacterized protein n=1 Tax=Tritrichomonas foetus TaxID=1144522 RepID=A0A1J4K2S1_9EUKA|nr:hypothetical protein TRFO_26481 [Tritrichomonas foetus]|eukprot:OHT05737.1 hypothetical protein TRFO_26481 [Tritrichomonas foetus]